MLVDLRERLARFGLRLHEDKTRRIEFGRLPALNRRRWGARRPDTFAFLGFTHYCRWTRDGRFVVKRKTQSKRLTRKLKSLREEARHRMHMPVAVQHRWLCLVLRATTCTTACRAAFSSLNAFYEGMCRFWFRALRRRSQRRMSWQDFSALLKRFPLLSPRIAHSRPCPVT
jgi:hypothetical protein